MKLTLREGSFSFFLPLPLLPRSSFTSPSFPRSPLYFFLRFFFHRCPTLRSLHFLLHIPLSPFLPPIPLLPPLSPQCRPSPPTTSPKSLQFSTHKKWLKLTKEYRTICCIFTLSLSQSLFPKHPPPPPQSPCLRIHVFIAILFTVRSATAVSLQPQRKASPSLTHNKALIPPPRPSGVRSEEESAAQGMSRWLPLIDYSS